MKESDRVPLGSKLALGCGALLDSIGQHSVKQLALPIFNIGLGVSPALIGLALTIFRFWDAMIDPSMGAISDRSRSRHGRRRPWMLLGAILTGAIFPLFWCVSRGWSHQVMAAYFIGVGVLYFTAYTIFSVPYHALSFEMTPDYDEKTRLMTYRTVFNGIGGIVIGWLYAITQWSVFKDTLQGVRWVSVAVGLVLIVVGCVPALVIRERFLEQARHQPSTPFWQGLGMTLRSVPFAILTLMAMAVLVGGNATNSLGFYLSIYHVYHGDTAAASIAQGWAATGGGVLTVLVLPGMAWVATHLGKLATMAIAIFLNVACSISAWFLITPASPWLQLIPFMLGLPGVMSFWLMFSTMSADVCDYDEWKYGLRREGMFSAVYAWISKMAVSLSYGLSGVVIAASGFRQELGGQQSEAAITWMRSIYAFGPVGLYLAAGILLLWYPLTRQRMADIRLDLEARRGAA